MPINARPQYFAAEKKYYEAKTVAEKITALEEMLRTAPKHKSAEVLVAGIKQKLAKYRDLLEKEKKAKGKGFQISVKKEGAAQAVIVSVPNAGKSLLLSKLTNAKPEVADYDFTTRMPEVGIMELGGVKIQLVEMPAIYEDYAYKGDGPTFFSIIRNADIIIVLIDSTKSAKTQLKLIHQEFEKAQIRLNKPKPPIKIKKTGSGGIHFVGEKKIRAKIGDVKKLLQEQGLHNAIVEFYKKTNLEELADALNEGLVFMPCVTVYNKADLTKNEDGVSAMTGQGIEQLKKDIWKKLEMIKVFTKTPGKPKEWPPVALKKGSTIRDLAMQIHKDFVKNFKFARVWGESTKFDGQMLGLDHKLEEGDIVEFHLK